MTELPMLWWILGATLILLALFWPQPLYALTGIGDPERFTQARFQRSARLNRRLIRLAAALLGGAFLAHALADQLPAAWATWLQVGPFCLAWTLVLAMLGVTAWFARGDRH